MNKQVCLEHKLIDVPGFRHDLLAISGQEQRPSINDGVGGLDHIR